MTFEIRKVSNVGTAHPVVARLGVQASDLINWIEIEESKRNEIAELYVCTLKDRLLRCHQFRDDLVAKVNSAVEAQPVVQSDKRIREVPHIVDLQSSTESFLYAVKNYLRDLLNLFRIVYGCKLTDASAFTNLKGNGVSDLVSWAISTFGADGDLTKLLKTEQEWVAEFIRMRNAVEHPAGLSGTLTLNNIRVVPNQPNSYIPPTWARTGRPESNIVEDMDTCLNNMLTVAEDLLVGVVMDKSKAKNLITVYETPVQDRDSACPIRLRIGPSQEMLARLPQQDTPPAPRDNTRELSNKQLIRQQDRTWREKKKRQT